MKIYYVFQNQSKKQELNGKYLWSPQKNQLVKMIWAI